jgi:hypothetical protein
MMISVMRAALSASRGKSRALVVSTPASEAREYSKAPPNGVAIRQHRLDIARFKYSDVDHWRVGGARPLQTYGGAAI